MSEALRKDFQGLEDRFPRLEDRFSKALRIDIQGIEDIFPTGEDLFLIFEDSLPSLG